MPTLSVECWRKHRARPPKSLSTKFWQHPTARVKATLIQAREWNFFFFFVPLHSAFSRWSTLPRGKQNKKIIKPSYRRQRNWAKYRFNYFSAANKGNKTNRADVLSEWDNFMWNDPSGRYTYETSLAQKETVYCQKKNRKISRESRRCKFSATCSHLDS